MSQIDSIGTYRGTIAEAGVGVTKTGKPQFIVRLTATEKYVVEPSELTHFKLTEPAYVDWSSFGESITAFLLLFNSPDTFDKDTAMLNYEQVQVATGWDGQSFDTLADTVGKTILFRVGDKKPYTNDQGKVVGEGQVEVSWIDAADAAPERALKTLATDDIKALNAKLKMARPKPATAPAKPAKPAPSAPAATTASTPAPASAPAAPKAKKAKAVPPPPKVEPAEVPTGLPAETDQMTAWEYVITHKGGNDDTVVQDAWISAGQEVGGDRDEADFTPSDWAKVRDIVIRDLAL